jgi:hypothetical protein
MRKRTRIAVVTAALLVAVVAPTLSGAQGTGRAALASGAVTAGAVPVDPGDVMAGVRWLESIIPTAGRVRAGRSSFFTKEQRWRLMSVACTVNDVHGYVYESDIDERLWDLEPLVPGAYRQQGSVLELSEQIDEGREDLGSSFGQATARFCHNVGRRVDRRA